MKTVYIPKGETVTFQNLETGRIVVKGSLHISGELNAKSISGPGSVSAGQICASMIRVGELEAGHVRCNELEAGQVEVYEVFASQHIAVSGRLTAGSVKTKWLAMTRSEIEDVEAGEIICLPAKHRGMPRFLLAARLRSWWLRFTAPEEDVVDEDFEQAEDQGQKVIDFETKDEERPAA